MKQPPDENARWIRMLRAGKPDDSRALIELEKACWPIIRKMVKNNQGKLQDAEDLMQESLLSLSIAVVDGTYREESSLKNYLLAIARYKWLTRLREKKRSIFDWNDDALAHLNLPEPPPSAPMQELELIRSKAFRMAYRHIREICLRILRMLYWYGWSHEKIARLLKLPSEDSSKMQKKRCVDEIKRILIRFPELKRLLEEYSGWN